MPRCCVETCSNRSGIAGVTFHKVPFKMKETWYNILKKHGIKNISFHMAVCSDHFRTQDLDKDGFRTVLKKGAVPCLYLDKPKPKSEDYTNLPVHKKLVRVVKFELKKKKTKRTIKTGKRKNSIDDNKTYLDAAGIEIKLLQSTNNKYYCEEENIANNLKSNYNEMEFNSPIWFSEEKLKIVDIESILKN